MKNTRSTAVRELAQGTFDLRLDTPYQCLSFVLALVMLVQPLAVPLAFADPAGEQVIQGTADFTRAPGLTTITTSESVIINYDSFDILAGETVQFVQPGATSAALNRILNAVPTNIDGTLQANGRVYLVNPAGVIFGAGSVVDVGQLFAAAGAMSNEDFNANLNQFTGVEGAVQNAGTINADVVALIGRAVENVGAITATDGLVVLAAGESVLIGDPAAGVFVAFTPGAAAQAGPGVSNTGSIDAGPTGRALLAASDVYALAFQQGGTGSVTAETVQVQAEDGAVEIGGTVDATNLIAQSGGDVTLQADVTLDGGTLHLEADSPHRTGGADGAGTVALANDVNAVTGNGSATLIGADFDLGTGATVDSGTGNINVARSRNADTLDVGSAAEAQLGDTELAALTTTGTLTLGRATTAGANGDPQGGQALAGETFRATAITRAAGSLALAGTTAVTLDDTIDVDAGSLTVDGPFTATGNLVASNDVTLNGSGTLDGLDQRIDAEAGTLDVNGDLLKVTAGDLEIGGASALRIAGNVQTPGIGATDALVLEDDATLDGADQRIDAIVGSLVTAGLDKSTAGRLNLGGDAGVRVGGAVSANSLVVQSAGNVRLEQDVALAGGALNLEADSPNRAGVDGVGTLTIDPAANVTTDGGAATLIAADFELGAGSTVDAGAGAVSVTRSRQADALALGTAAGAQLDDAELDTLTTTGTVTLGRATTFGIDDEGTGVTTLTSENITAGAITRAAGSLALAGTTAVDLDDTIDVDAGSLTVDGPFTATGNLVASNDVTLNGSGTLDGADQRIDAEAGTLDANGDLVKTTAGNLALAGDVAMRFAGDVTTTGATGADTLSLENAATLDAAATQRVDAGAGTLTTAAVTKDGTGNLVLGGDVSVDLNGSVDVNAGNLAVEDTFTAAGDLLASNDLALQGAGTFDGFATNQRVDAEGGVLTAGALTKTVPGDLTLGGATAIDLNGTVSTAGNLTIEDTFTAAGDLTSLFDLNVPTGTLDGAANQRIATSAGVLTAGALTKTTPGNLNLGGPIGTDLNGTVDVNAGDLIVENRFTAAGDLLASGNLSIASIGTLDGGADQRVDAEGGTLIAGPLTKNGAGNLALGGATGIDLNATVDVNTGNLTVEDTFTAAGNLVASGSTSVANGTLDGAADQRIDAEGRALTAAALTKTGAGNLALGGATGLDLNGTVDVDAGNLAVEDTFTAAGDLLASGDVSVATGTLDGADQRIDAEGGSLIAAALTKSTAGNLTLGGQTGLDLNGTVDVNGGSLLVGDPFTAAGDLRASASMNLANGTLDGAVDQRVDAEGGNLAAGSLTKNGAGNLALGGATGLDLNGTVDVNAGNLTVEDTFSAGGDLLASSTVALPTGTLDGANQRIDAEAGALSAGALTKTGAGNLALGGATGLDLNGTVDVNAGNLAVEDTFTAAGDLLASGDVALPTGALDGADQRIDAEGGALSAGALTKSSAGNLALGGATGLDLNGTVDVNAGNLAVEDNFNAGGDILASGGTTVANGTLDGAINQRVDAESGALVAGALTKSGAGNLNVGGATALDLNGTVDVNAGNLTVEDTFTAGGNLLASGNVALPTGTLDGAASQRIDAEGGALTAGALTKNGDGNLALGGATGLDLNGTVDVNVGDLAVEDAFTASGDLLANNNLNMFGTGTLDGAASQRIAAGDKLGASTTLTKTTAGNLAIAAGNGAALGGTVDVNAGSLAVEDAFTAGGNLLASADVTLGEGGAFNGVGAQMVEAEGGSVMVDGDLMKSSAGDLALNASETLAFTDEGAQTVEAENGNVTLEASAPDNEFSSIFKQDGDLTINVAGGTGGVTTVSKVAVTSGNLTINAPGGAVNISDLTAQGVLTVNASSINLTSRASGPAFEITGNQVNDFDADFVGSRIDFSVAPTGSGSFVFGTPTGAEVNAPIQNSQFLKRALSTTGESLTPAVFTNAADPVGSVRDLTPAGGSTTDPASDIAAVLADLALAPEAPELADASAAEHARADDVLIFLECFPLEGQTEELPESCNAEEYGVAATPTETTPPVGAPPATPAAVAAGVTVAPAIGSAARPATTPQMNALRIYRDLRAKPVVPVLEDAVADYKSATGATEVKGADFRRYVETNPSQTEAVGYLNSMRSMVGELRQAGMTPAQFLRAAQQVVGEMTPAGISPAELGVAIEAGGQAGWPPLYLEQEEVAELLGDASQ